MKTILYILLGLAGWLVASGLVLRVWFVRGRAYQTQEGEWLVGGWKDHPSNPDWLLTNAMLISFFFWWFLVIVVGGRTVLFGTVGAIHQLYFKVFLPTNTHQFPMIHKPFDKAMLAGMKEVEVIAPADSYPE